jgi:Xaa-Pro aminopeptidase
MNYLYFTGHRSQQNPIDKIRPYVFLLPRDGDPVCFVMPFEEGHIQLTTWVDEVQTYQLFKHNEVIAATMADRGLSRGRIGCELGREQFLGVNYDDFTELTGMLPDAEFVDASPIFLRLRVIKSPAEVERIRTSSVITARALDQTFGMVKPGMTNLEVAQLVRRFIVEGGGERATFLAVASGHDFTKGKITVPTPRRLEVGDTLTVDTGTELRGYASDVCRTAVIGQATQQQKDMYRFVAELNRTCYEVFQPGALCEDVALTCLREIERVGRKTQSVGRIGHGVGCETTEFPSLAVGEKVAMEPGMVFACNPNFVTEFGFFNMEENLVVTESGYEYLSDPLASPDLPVLG